MTDLYFANDYGHSFWHASPDRWWVELHGSDTPIVELCVRERQADDPPSDYWGWFNENEAGRYTMIYPSRKLFEMCFPYGSKAEEKRGRGRAVNLTVTRRAR